MGFGMADRANALVEQGAVTPATRDDSPPSQPNTETAANTGTPVTPATQTTQADKTEQAAQATQTATDTANTSRPAPGEAGSQAKDLTETAKTDAAVTLTPEEIQEINTAVDSGDTEKLGQLDEHPRFRQVIAERREFKSRAESAEAQLESAKARESLLLETIASQSSSQVETSVVEGYVPPSSVSEEEREQLSQAGFTGPYAKEDAQAAVNLNNYRLALIQQVKDNELTLEEAEASYAHAEGIEASNKKDRELPYYQQQAIEARLKGERQAKLNEAETASKKALVDFPFADPEFLGGYIVQGSDPTAAAKYLHEKVAPIVARETAKAVEAALSPIKAAHAQEIAALNAAHEAAVNKIMGRRALPSTIGVGNGGAAPNMGTEAPKPSGRFGMRERIEQVRQAAGMGR